MDNKELDMNVLDNVSGGATVYVDYGTNVDYDTLNIWTEGLFMQFGFMGWPELESTIRADQTGWEGRLSRFQVGVNFEDFVAYVKRAYHVRNFS